MVGCRCDSGGDKLGVGKWCAAWEGGEHGCGEQSTGCGIGATGTSVGPSGRGVVGEHGNPSLDIPTGDADDQFITRPSESSLELVSLTARPADCTRLSKSCTCAVLHAFRSPCFFGIGVIRYTPDVTNVGSVELPVRDGS